MTSVTLETQSVRVKQKIQIVKNQSEEDDVDRYSLRRCRNIPSSPSYPPISTNGKTLPQYYTQTADELFHCITEDLHTILDAADQSFTFAEQARKVFQTTFDQIDPDNPRCEEIGIYGALKDLREETMRAVCELERARLRSQKVQSEMTKLRRGLRSFGLFRSHGQNRGGNHPGNDQWRHLYNFYD